MLTINIWWINLDWYLLTLPYPFFKYLEIQDAKRSFPLGCSHHQKCHLLFKLSQATAEIFFLNTVCNLMLTTLALLQSQQKHLDTLKSSVYAHAPCWIAHIVFLWAFTPASQSFIVISLPNWNSKHVYLEVQLMWQN